MSFFYIKSFIKEKVLNKNSNYDIYLIIFLFIIPIGQFILYIICVKNNKSKPTIDTYFYEIFNVRLDENKELDFTGTFLWELIALFSYLFLFALKKCIAFNKEIKIDYEEIKISILVLKFTNAFFLFILIIDKFNIYQVFYVALIISYLFKLNFNYYDSKSLTRLGYIRINLLFLILNIMGIFNFAYIRNYLKKSFPNYFNDNNDDLFFFMTDRRFDKKRIFYILITFAFLIELINTKIMEYIEIEEDQDDHEVENNEDNKEVEEEKEEEKKEEKVEKVEKEEKEEKKEKKEMKEKKEELDTSTVMVTKMPKKYDSDSSDGEVRKRKRNLKKKFKRTDNKYNNTEKLNNEVNINKFQQRKQHKFKYYLLVFKNDIMRVSIIYLLYTSQNIFSLFYVIVFFFSFIECSNYKYNLNFIFNFVLFFDFISFSFIKSDCEIALALAENKFLMKYIFNYLIDFRTLHRILMLLILIINVVFISIKIYNITERKTYFFHLKQENKLMQFLNLVFNEFLCLIVLPFFSNNNFFHLSKIFFLKFSVLFLSDCDLLFEK